MPMLPLPRHGAVAADALQLPRLANQLRAMRVLLAVVQQGSTARAAEAIHLSQPAAARAIVQLEKACGLSLFTRVARGMVPTAAGAQLAVRTEAVHQHLACGAAEAMALAMSAARRSTAPQRFPSVVPPNQLRALVAIATCGSEAPAAAWLGVSQPAVHAALQGLQSLVGVRLFYKLPSGTRLTPAGEALLRRVKLALAEIRSMESDIAAWQGAIRGRVVVGMLPLSVTMFLPRAVDLLASRHPEIEVHIVDGTYESLMRYLLSADIDAIAGALRADAPASEVRLHPLFEDDLVVVARTGHPCLHRKDLRLKQLLQCDWVRALPGTPADRAMESIFAADGLAAPRGSLRVGSPAMTLSFVMQTGRLALVSRGEALLNDGAGQLCVVPLALPATRRRIGLATRAYSTPSPDLNLFLEACRDAAAMA